MEVLSCIKSEIKQISHSSYHCEYHILFVPKYKRKVIYKLLKKIQARYLEKYINMEILKAEAKKQEKIKKD